MESVSTRLESQEVQEGSKWVRLPRSSLVFFFSLSSQRLFFPFLLCPRFSSNPAQAFFCLSPSLLLLLPLPARYLTTAAVAPSSLPLYSLSSPFFPEISPFHPVFPPLLFFFLFFLYPFQYQLIIWNFLNQLEPARRIVRKNWSSRGYTLVHCTYTWIWQGEEYRLRKQASVLFRKKPRN